MVDRAARDDVRLATNIVDCDPESMFIGMKVAVRFEQSQDLWVPLFAPETAA
ncbi:hypothetical protein Q5H94_05180 [Sphingomonas sp. CA1-15]|uniref:DUF35 domain-containing protein n=2 Tax=Sphingomonas immobilis TaxID=3063997 RepID=A0ABT8ZVW4_9SPHN|nr:hypothetical protein [Sphingomonas sp. CA1-15]